MTKKRTGAINECYRCGGLANPLFAHTQEDCLDQLLKDKKMLRSNLDHSDNDSIEKSKRIKELEARLEKRGSHA